jgi:predicted N-acyltransferase
MAFEVSIFNSIAEIGESEWDSLSIGQPFQSYKWHRFGEVIVDSRPSYVILSEGGHPVARVSFWRVSNEPLARGFMSPILRRWPLLICRSPLSNVSGLVLTNPMRASKRVFEEIIRIGRILKRRENCLALIFDCVDAATAHAIPHTVSYSFGDPGTKMEIQANSFDQYAAGLPKKERSDIRRDLRIIEEQGISVTRHSVVDDLDEAEGLYRMVELRKGPAHNPWMRSMLENIKMANGTWLAARIDGKLIGCVATYEDQTTGGQLLTHMGLRSTTKYAYFALLYESIRLGLEHGLSQFYWGSGSYAVKKRLGFSIFENDSLAITI